MLDSGKARRETRGVLATTPLEGHHMRPTKLSTLAALCTALECGPADLIEVDTTPVVPAARPTRAKRPEPSPGRGRTMPPL